MSDYRIAVLTIAEDGVVARSKAIEQEREVALADLLENNVFQPAGSVGGPYNVAISVQENRLAFDIARESGGAEPKVTLPLGPFRGVIKDYFLVCDSYYKAIRTAPPQQIEALDMGRRGLHDEGSTILRKQLEGKVTLDFDTARRLFTLICVMHLKG